MTPKNLGIAVCVTVWTYLVLTLFLGDKGLVALKDHFETVYRLEGGDARFDLSEDEVVISVSVCPAVRHMRDRGYPVARMFAETTRTVNEALCEGTPIFAELVQYDPQTGRSVQRFGRRYAGSDASGQGRQS